MAGCVMQAEGWLAKLIELVAIKGITFANAQNLEQNRRVMA